MPVLHRQIYWSWDWDSADQSKAAPLLHMSPWLRPRSSAEDSTLPPWDASSGYCCDFYSSLQTWHPFCLPAFKKSCTVAIEPPGPRASPLVSTPLEGWSGGKGHEEWNFPRGEQGISEWSAPSHLEGRLRQGVEQPSPPGSWGWCTEGGFGHDLAHLLGAALLQKGWKYGPAVFRGGFPHHGTGPLWVSSRLAMGHFSGKIETSGQAAQLPQVHEGGALRAAPDVIWHILLMPALPLVGGAPHLPSSGEVALTMGQVPCESGGDQTKHSGSYPWGVCQGPRPLKTESGRIEWPPVQRVKGCWGEFGAMPLPAPWALAGPWEKSQVLANGGQLHPLIVQPHDMLEIHSFLHVVGDMSGYPRQETILLGYAHPGQGEGQI